MNKSLVLDALRERGSWTCQYWRCLKQNMTSRGQRKGKKVAVGPGPREYKSGHETNKCGEVRVRWKGLCALKGGSEHGYVKVGVTNRSRSSEDRERERKRWLDQDQEGLKLDMRQPVVGSCALDGGG